MNLSSTIIINLVSFFIGYMLGVGSGIVIKDKTKLFETIKLSDFVALMVVLMWVISMTIDIISPTYETSPFVQGLMGAIVGFFYKQKFDEQKKQ